MDDLARAVPTKEAEPYLGAVFHAQTKQMMITLAFCGYGIQPVEEVWPL